MSSYDERAYELALLRCLGARQSQLRRLLLLEYGMLALLACILATAGAVSLGSLIAHQLLKLDHYASNWSSQGIGIAAGILFIVTAASLAARSLLRQSPAQVLQSLS